MVEGVLVGPLGRTGGPTVEGSPGPKLKAGASWPKWVLDGPNVQVRGIHGWGSSTPMVAMYPGMSLFVPVLINSGYGRFDPQISPIV